MRTHFCGLVDEALIGQTVTLCGWADVARNLGGLCFIDLRDHEGIVQIVAEPSDAAGNAAVVAAAAQVGYEDCLRITGIGARAPERQRQDHAPARSKSSRRRSSCSTRPSRCRSTRTRTPGEDIRLQVPLPRPAHARRCSA